MEVPFTLAAEPNTDLWRKPPSTDDHNAPIKVHSKKPLLSFRSATISFRGVYTTQFDQAGLHFQITNPSKPSSKPKWIKTGVEFFQDEPRLSVVCCDQYSDWSIAYIPGGATRQQAVRDGKESVTIQVEVDETTVWVYYVDENGNKLHLREIAWVFGEDAGEGWEIEVGALVARPNKDVKGNYEAVFEKLDVDWK